MAFLKTRPFVKQNNGEFTNLSSVISLLMCSTHCTTVSSVISLLMCSTHCTTVSSVTSLLMCSTHCTLYLVSLRTLCAAHTVQCI